MFCFLPTIRRIPPQSNEVPSSTGPWFFSCTKNGSKNGAVWITEVQYLLKLFLGSLNLSLTFFVSVGPCLNTWYTVEILKVENKFRLNKKMNTLFLPTANIYEPRFDNPPIYIYISIYIIYLHTGLVLYINDTRFRIHGGSSGALRRMRIGKIGSLRFRSLPHQERSFAWIKSQGMTKFLHWWKLSKHLKVR